MGDGNRTEPENTEPELPSVSLGEIFQAANVDPFWAMRGKAIQAYATLEQSLCRLFAHLAGMAPDVAALIFFKITSSQARNSILDRLIRKRHGSEYSLFWNSFFKELRPIDINRNEIVHWNTASEVSFDGGTPQITVKLRPPNIWSMDENTPEIRLHALQEFAVKTDFFARACNMFLALLEGDTAQPWQDIFRQPLVYPPQNTHPLSRNYKGPESPPRSSPE